MELDLEAVREYFRATRHEFCGGYIGSGGLRFLTAIAEGVQVHITCCNCNQAVGIAFVSGVWDRPLPAKKVNIVEKPQAPAITADEVIDAHLFFQSLGDDWMKHLPYASKNQDEGSQHTQE